jgi:hypothetical protein
MQAKTQKQVMTLQNKAQKVADKLNEEVIFITKGVQHIQAQIITPSSSATSKSSPTFLAIRLDFLASKSLAFN